MSQLTDLAPSLSPRRQARGARGAAVAAALAGGFLAAGLGLGFLAVLVLLLWITSPYPDSGPGGALRVVADLWLLAHGADLVRTETRTGVPAPVGLTPLLLTALPVFLLHRTARDALTPQDGRPQLAPLATGAWVACGYLAVAATVTGYALGGPLHAAPLSAAVVVPLTVSAATAAGVWSAAGTPAVLLPRRRRPAAADARAGAAPRAEAVARAGAAGVVALVGGGALLCGIALVTHAAVAQEHFLSLSGTVSGRFGVFLLALALLPNAAVWAAAYGLGPGFTVGAGSAVAPLGAADYPVQPVFPLLAAVPGEGPGGPLTWAAAAVPAVAGVVVGCFAGRAAAPVAGERGPSWRWWPTVWVTASAALACGAGTAALAWLAGGPLGTRTLAEFGPVWWQAGGAAVAWTAVIGVPVALVVRAVRLRGADPLVSAGRPTLGRECGGRGAVAAPGAPVRGRRWRWGRQGWPLWEPRSRLAEEWQEEPGGD
ncbi:DUF6350 family protein [Streptomyces sp. MAR4 CNX-425]|uniref:cell division protein PerM n=1 Tax=Streptomyces sp. MAR4 CNX-425 TaxID=3406343 RepID=UPI003B5096A0